MSAFRSDSRYSNRDVENTISFLQAEHAKILDGLHEQIRSLQQRCTQLTFELAMKSSSSPEPTPEKLKDSETTACLEEGLRSARVETHSLQAKLADNKDKMVALEEDLKRTQEELVCERKAKNESSQNLHVKADTIANLMTQLHKEKQKSKKVMEQLKLYGDANFDKSPSIRMKSGKPKIQMTIKYPSNHHHTNESLSETTPSFKDMPRPPTTPPPGVSSGHIRRATTPTKDLVSQRRLGSSSSVRRKLPTVPQGASFFDVQTRNPEQLRNGAEWALNPLRKEDPPGYQDFIKGQQGALVRPQSRQFPILPPIEGQITSKGQIFDEEESAVYHQTIKAPQSIGSAKINPPMCLEPGGQQAWANRLSPQSQYDSQ